MGGLLLTGVLDLRLGGERQHVGEVLVTEPFLPSRRRLLSGRRHSTPADDDRIDFLIRPVTLHVFGDVFHLFGRVDAGDPHRFDRLSVRCSLVNITNAGKASNVHDGRHAVLQHAIKAHEVPWVFEAAGKTRVAALAHDLGDDHPSRGGIVVARLRAVVEHQHTFVDKGVAITQIQRLHLEVGHVLPGEAQVVGHLALGDADGHAILVELGQGPLHCAVVINKIDFVELPLYLAGVITRRIRRLQSKLALCDLAPEPSDLVGVQGLRPRLGGQALGRGKLGRGQRLGGSCLLRCEVVLVLAQAAGVLTHGLALAGLLDGLLVLTLLDLAVYEPHG